MRGLRYQSFLLCIQRICPRRINPDRGLPIIAVIIGLTLSPAMGADADHGAELAKRWCASCHVVNSDQKQASADVPPFAALAQRSDFGAEKLAFFLLEPHPKMPNYPLSRNEAGDIAAYIETLRK
jgi:mono/diheme cytochrome c family protein